MHPLFYLAALIPVVLLRRRMASKAISKMSPPSTLVSVDLAGYDAEQCRLMGERCIVVDENDKAIGALDKKTCAYTSLSSKVPLFGAFSDLFCSLSMAQVISWKISTRGSCIGRSLYSSSDHLTDGYCCNNALPRKLHFPTCGPIPVARILSMISRLRGRRSTS
jgi:hypothetical protein